MLGDHTKKLINRLQQKIYPTQTGAIGQYIIWRPRTITQALIEEGPSPGMNRRIRRRQDRREWRGY